jgi:hypothetical protein
LGGVLRHRLERPGFLEQMRRHDDQLFFTTEREHHYAAGVGRDVESAVQQAAADWDLNLGRGDDHDVLLDRPSAWAMYATHPSSDPRRA